MNDNRLACNKQHGFTAERSTLTNLLASENVIAYITLQLVILMTFYLSILNKRSTKPRIGVSSMLWQHLVLAGVRSAG
jgi:hypothetical protein